ncbi:MAG: molybdenum cofactor guanylyltransferase [Candidatus Bathyarchaeia archaeon]
MDGSAIVLAGGSSTRLGQDKGLLLLANRPLIRHVLDAVNGLVKETIVVVSSQVQARNYAKSIDPNVRVLVDASNVQTPLVGALTGFKSVEEEFSLILSCDVPLVSKNVLSLLLDLSTNKSATIPRWPSGCIEPLQSVYCTKLAEEAAQSALKEGRLNMQAMIDRLRGIRFVSTLVLEQLDPGLKTFFNVNTLLDLKKAEAILKRVNANLSLPPK